ncbi:hypothetical protein [Paenibacillus sp. Soil766]|uniref:hypothetical protein n=1 Tax=Paenibacillus sp. Soil766 TaxID=1736404 RepID=UPI000A94F80A|nr:hypothetical protein [Paenibacillus sp. Soil766]
MVNKQDFGHTIPEGTELQVMAVTPTKYALIIAPKPEELDELKATGVQPQMAAWS